MCAWVSPAAEAGSCRACCPYGATSQLLWLQPVQPPDHGQAEHQSEHCSPPHTPGVTVPCSPAVCSCPAAAFRGQTGAAAHQPRRAQPLYQQGKGGNSRQQHRVTGWRHPSLSTRLAGRYYPPEAASDTPDTLLLKPCVCACVGVFAGEPAGVVPHLPLSAALLAAQMVPAARFHPAAGRCPACPQGSPSGSAGHSSARCGTWENTLSTVGPRPWLGSCSDCRGSWSLA